MFLLKIRSCDLQKRERICILKEKEEKPLMIPSSPCGKLFRMLANMTVRVDISKYLCVELYKITPTIGVDTIVSEGVY